MDANGLKFWLLAEEQHWQLPGDPAALEYDAQRRSLRLARQRRELDLAEDRDKAETRLERLPQARDCHGNRAWYDPGLHSIMAVGVNDTPVLIYQLEEAAEMTDLAMGEDGVLYMAVGGAVLMHDRRERWQDALVRAEGFSAWRLSPAPETTANWRGCAAIPSPAAPPNPSARRPLAPAMRTPIHPAWRPFRQRPGPGKSGRWRWPAAGWAKWRCSAGATTARRWCGCWPGRCASAIP
jgi:hypothetical protein